MFWYDTEDFATNDEEFTHSHEYEQLYKWTVFTLYCKKTNICVHENPFKNLKKMKICQDNNKHNKREQAKLNSCWMTKVNIK